MQAIVYKSTGSWYIVRNNDGQIYNARIKGKFKIDEITSTNPIAVGDIVEIENEEDTESTVITEIYERKNYINRVSPHNKNQHHIVAANLDQSLLFATLKEWILFREIKFEALLELKWSPLISTGKDVFVFFSE